MFDPGYCWCPGSSRECDMRGAASKPRVHFVWCFIAMLETVSRTSLALELYRQVQAKKKAWPKNHLKGLFIQAQSLMCHSCSTRLYISAVISKPSCNDISLQHVNEAQAEVQLTC
eukprot:6189085-Pleurochrysis_carterae.AAC.3